MSNCWPLQLTEDLLPAGEELRHAHPPECWQLCLAVEGVVYWVGRPASRELQAGELIVCAPDAEGSLRASQLNNARIRRFCFNPASVVGVFSLSERVGLSRPAPGRVEILPAGHAAARLVAHAPLPDSGDSHLSGRAELLHAAMLALSGWLPDTTSTPHRPSSSEHRLRELLINVPDGEVISRSAEDLAAMCGCSVRHLNRLIRTELACNLRHFQEEARLRRARELIEQTGARVADIARSVGYGHVGQFNAAFKRHFGLTPSKCREACFQDVTCASSPRHKSATP